MMRKFLMTTVSVLAIGGSALAADLPSPRLAPPPPIIPIFTWTGFYVGVNAGFGFRDSDDDDLFFDDDGIDDDNGFFDNGDDGNDGGFVGGGQIGYLYQMGTVVLGVEADLQYADLGGNRDDFFFDDRFNGRNGGIDWFGTARGILGLAFDRSLIYATGGFAYADGGGGFAAGGGFKYAFTNNVSAGIEGLWVSLDHDDNNNGFFFDDNGFDDDDRFFGNNGDDNGFFVVRGKIDVKFW